MKWKIINFIETTKHRLWVAWYLLKVCYALLRRAIVHDLSKYSKLEAPYFEKALPNLRNLEYGSDEYKKALASLGPALQHHYNNNFHHPEFYDLGVRDMTMLDCLEMLCDWKAATRRHVTGNIQKSLKYNQKRFKINVFDYNALERDLIEIGLN